MKKMLAFLSLAFLFGVVGCAPKATTEPALTSPAADEQPVADEIATDETAPPKGKFVLADPKLATLRAKFVYGGQPPAREQVDSSRDPFCSQLKILSEAMLVSKEGGLKNLALIMDERTTKAEIPADQLKVPPATIELDNNGCVFIPHVLFARPGQTISVLNSDQTGHNANFSFFKNDAVNFLIPVGGKKEIELKTAESAVLIPVECNIHPWMKAFVIVQEHPYVGITDENGQLEIINLPVGAVSFLIRHENAEGSIDEGTVNGKVEKWSRGRMDLDLKAGVNDLGTITIAPDKFKS